MDRNVLSSAFQASALKLDSALEQAAHHLLKYLQGTLTGASFRSEFAILPDTQQQPSEECLQILWDENALFAVGVYSAALRRQLDQYMSGHDTTLAPSPALGTSPVVTASLVDGLGASGAALLLFLLPSHDSLWNSRRRWITNHLSTTNGKLTREKLLELLKIFIITDLILSFYKKIQQVWVFRGWLISLMVQKNIIGPESSPISMHLLYEHDKTMFSFAADQHPMNYNAWNYRRFVLPLQLQYINGSDQVDQFFRKEVGFVLSFLVTHNGDSSVTSFLMWLLLLNERHDRKNGSGLHCLWHELMSITQKEIHRHYEKGHECVWHLRLGLVQWALEKDTLKSAWTLQDELLWVTTIIEGWKSEESTFQLLGPISTNVEKAWVESSGSVEWTSYLACRYGLQLLDMVSGSKGL